MNFKTDIFKTIDNQTIFYYKWFAAENMPFKGVVQIAHGIGEHAGRYHSIAEKLQNEGFEVYANDHRNHGKSVKNEDYLGYYDGKDYFEDALNDMRQFSKIIQKEHPKNKIILLGHSMGSFLSRAYAIKFGEDLEVLILSGTGSFIKFLGAFGILSTKFFTKMNGRHKSNELLKNMFFAQFNNAFKPNRTSVDWISRDEHQVDLFEADPLRIEDFSLCVFLDVLEGTKKINEMEAFENTPKNLPIYLFSGDEDPVGEMGKGVLKVFDNYKNAGIKDVTLKLYQNGRHEMLNEINKIEVENDLLNWLNQKVTANK